MHVLNEYPTQAKEDVLRFDDLPTGRCEMNFRPPLKVKQHRSTVIGTVKVALIGGLIWSLVVVALSAGISTTPAAREPVTYFILAGIVAALLTLPKRDERAVAYLAAGAVVLLMLVMISKVYFPLFSQAFLSGSFLFLAMPAALVLADRIATHRLFWYSASPRLDLATLRNLRTLWATRFSLPWQQRPPAAADAEQSARLAHFQLFVRLYPLLLAGIAGVVWLVMLTISLLAPVDQASRVTLLGAGLLMMSMGACVHWQFPGTLGLVWRAVVHFLAYDTSGYPPWVVQPAGSLESRRSLFYFAVLAFSVPLVACSLTDLPTFRPHYWQSFGLALVNAVFLGLLFCPVFLLATGVVAMGPLLWTLRRNCEGRKATLSRRGWTTFDAYVDRLHHSENAKERDSIWIGFHSTLGFPVLIAVELVREHLHILGATGMGKTGLGIASLVAQLILRDDGPVIIIDAKGDRALLHSVMAWSARLGRKMKWFTTAEGKSTYIFNPFGQKSLDSMTLPELVGLFMLAFNLNHGDDYGRAWYALVSKATMMAAFQQNQTNRPTTFEDFCGFVELAITSSPEFGKDAMNLLLILRSISEFVQVNASAESHPEAYRNAINMTEAIENNEILYFNFESITDAMTTGEISRLVVYTAIAAAREYKERTGKKANTDIIVDEAQHVIAKNVSGVLEQSRSYGVALALCHQTRGQLKPPGGVDLREVVDNNTCVKLFFSARDPDSIKHLGTISGEVGYYRTGWQQFVHRVVEGDVGMHRAVHYGSDPAITNVSVERGPRLTPNDIMEVNHDANQCIMVIERDAGLSRFRGAFPVHIDFPISPEDYQQRNEATPWPSAPGETIDIGSFWPSATNETVVVPAIGAPFPSLTPEDLEAIAQKLLPRK